MEHSSRAASPDDAAAVNAAGQQVGEQEIHAAGRDVVYNGVDPAAALSLVRDVVWRLDQRIDVLHTEARYYQELEADRWRRQAEHNAALRRAVWGLTVALCLAAAVVGILVWREAAALMARAAFDIALTTRR